MEGMEETKKSEAHLTSAAAFVEGGIQDACDDACSICLEDFGDSDPSTVTSCKHEFHLQCILEWCQRSSQCPMCWQAISLKDPTSQELLEGVERERSFRINPPRNSAIFHHPTLGDFELQHLPVGVNDTELEERIIQHLAAAAAMGRARHIARREGQRNRLSTQNRPRFLVFSTHPDGTPPEPDSSSPNYRGEGESSPPDIVGIQSSTPTGRGGESPLPDTLQASVVVHQAPASAPESSTFSGNRQGNISNNMISNRSSPNNQSTEGPSENQSFSESLKSRLNAVSARYKESISRSTRSWKDRLFSRNTSMADLGTEVKREVNAGIATVSRMMEHLDTKNSGRSTTASSSASASDSNNLDTSSAGDSNNLETTSAGDSNNQQASELNCHNVSNETTIQCTSPASSGSS